MHIRRRIKTVVPTTNFEKALEEELLSAWNELAGLVNGGLTFVDNMKSGKIDYIADADGTLLDLTNKFNTLLSELKSANIMKTS